MGVSRTTTTAVLLALCSKPGLSRSQLPKGSRKHAMDRFLDMDVVRALLFNIVST